MNSRCANQFYCYRPLAEYFTSLSDMRVGVLSSVSTFNHERVHMSSSEQSDALKVNATGQTITCDGATSLQNEVLLAHNTTIGNMSTKNYFVITLREVYYKFIYLGHALAFEAVVLLKTPRVHSSIHLFQAWHSFELTLTLYKKLTQN